MNTAPVTTKELMQGIDLIKAIADAIRALGTVPSGHLYAHICGSIDADSFERILGILQRAGLVRIDASHLIHWIEPKGK